MSAIFGRIILTVGLGVIAAVVHTFFKNDNQREAHGHQQGGPRPDSDDSGRVWDGVPPSWRADSYLDDNDKDKEDEKEKRRRLRARKKSNESSNAATNDSSSIQKGCFICLETFEDLKRRGIPIWTTPCGHLFCKTCLERAIRMSPSCPSCRVSVSLTQCHKIHL